MFVKLHYSGLAISYGGTGGGRRSVSPTPSKKNDSRINRQKRAVHDAVEWMRLNAKYRPLIFCVTCPIQSDWTLQNDNLSKFCKNLRSNYEVQNYVWVREYTGGGRPHYHFVADCPFFDAPRLSRYWCSLFDDSAEVEHLRANSIRLGTKPPDRKFFVTSSKMARYLTKYMGKSLGTNESNSRTGKKIRTFGMSEEVAAKSAPVVYQVNYVESKTVYTNVFGKVNGTSYKPGQSVELISDIKREFVLTDESKSQLHSAYGQIPPKFESFDDREFSWICPNPLHHVYYGIPKKRQ